MRVMFLNWRDTGHVQGGGSERYVEHLAGALAEEGHEVVIQCARYPGSAAEQRRDGVTFLRRGGRLTVYLWGLLAVIRRRPELVIDVENGVPFFSPLVRPRRVVRLVHHLGRDVWLAWFGPVIGRLGWWIESRIVPRVYRSAACIAVSDSTRDDVVALGARPDRVAVVHNATEVTPRSDVTLAPTPTVCVVARLASQKRVEHAIEVVARLVVDVPDVRMRVIGDGPLRDRLAAYARERGVLDRVDLLGWVEEREKLRILASSWVLLCPSIKEGWARVVMEAGLQHVPTVAYRSGGGVTESVRHGETGLLAEDLDDLVEQTRWLLDHPEERSTMGKAAAVHAARFTPERTRDEFRHALALRTGPR